VAHAQTLEEVDGFEECGAGSGNVMAQDMETGGKQ
jgi:hypothetical protein